jgi:Flp pilus assembly protein TadD
MEAPIGELSMIRPFLASFLSLGLAFAAIPLQAADTSPAPAPSPAARVDDYQAGQLAVQAKNWTKAAEHFRKATERDPRNADAWNMLGYSSRWLGRMSDSMTAYERALTLQPDHKGANQYLGVAFLRNNELPKAEAQLAKLERICGSNCEETRLMAKAIADFKAGRLDLVY